jgi:hypothetical protein
VRNKFPSIPTTPQSWHFHLNPLPANIPHASTWCGVPHEAQRVGSFRLVPGQPVVCALGSRNKLPLSNMSSSTRYNGSTGFGRYSRRWEVQECRRGSTGGVFHLPTQVVPSSSVDRARQNQAKSGLRTKRSWVLDPTDLNGYPGCIYALTTAKRLINNCFVSTTGPQPGGICAYTGGASRADSRGSRAGLASRPQGLASRVLLHT